jgi:hypothetical protein
MEEQLELAKTNVDGMVDLKQECAKWKQNYDRLAIVLKSNNNKDFKEIDALMQEYQK